MHERIPTHAAGANHSAELTRPSLGWPHANLPRTEWIRPQDLRATHGMGRTLVYELMRAGLIQSACIRRPGKAAGIRLVNVASLNAYIASHLALPPMAGGERAAGEPGGVNHE